MRISDWSSDVCSSDLDAEDRAERLPLLCFRRAPEPGGDQGDEEREEAEREGGERGEAGRGGHADRGASTVMPGLFRQDRKSVVSGKSVSVRVDLGGRRIIKKKKK